MDRSQTSQIIIPPVDDSKLTGNTATVVILIIIIIIVILIIILIFFVFNRQSSTPPQTTQKCLFNNDCPIGNICIGGICRSLECSISAPPTNIQVTNPISGIVNISWTFVPGANSYRVYIGTNPNFNKFNAIDFTTTENTSAQFSNVISGFNYYIFVTSVNDCGESNKSQERNIFVTYIWPNKFTLNSAEFAYDPSWKAGIRKHWNYPTDKQVLIDYQCNGLICPCVDGCEYIYDDNNLEIQLASDPTLCLVQVPDELDPMIYDPKVALDICTNHINADKQWVFLEGSKNICLANNIGKCMESEFSSPTAIRITDYMFSSIERRKWEPVESQSN